MSICLRSRADIRRCQPEDDRAAIRARVGRAFQQDAAGHTSAALRNWQAAARWDRARLSRLARDDA